MQWIKISLLLTTSLLLHTNSLGQLPPSTTTRAMALGNCNATLEDEWAAFSNPAGLATLSNSSLAAAYSTNFSIKELSSQMVTAGIPTKYGHFNTSFTHFGFELFNQNNINLNYSRDFRKIRAGFQFNYLWNTIAEAGTFSAFYTRAGVQVQTNKELLLGIDIINPEGANITYPNQTTKIPTSFSLGIKWHPLSEIMVLGETEKTTATEPIYKIGVEYWIHPKASIIGGLQNRPFKNTVGLSFSWQKVKVNAAFLFNSDLGNSSGISTSYLFN